MVIGAWTPLPEISVEGVLIGAQSAFPHMEGPDRPLEIAIVGMPLIAALGATTMAAEVLIGMAGPMTGPSAWFGEQMQRGRGAGRRRP